MPSEKAPLIALLATPDTSPSVLYGLYDVLYSVGAVYPDMTVGEPGAEALDVKIVAAGGRPFRCIGDILVEPHASLDDVVEVDAVVVCDMYTPINVPPKGKYPEEVAWLRKIHERGALVCSVCSGSVVLAEAGLLDDRDAAAHWAYKELFRRHYPKVRLRSELILCRTSEADGVVTAGGVAAWHDLVFYLIARFCGRKQSIETAKVFLLSGHEDGQLPYAMMNRCGSIDDQVVIGCQEWVAENYSRENPVEHMAEHSGLTPRTFARRFRAATGYAPLEYVQMVRVEEAKQMLETDAVAIDDVGEAVGYDDPASFRRIFKRLAGLTPASYRRKFQRIAQIAEPV